MKFALMTLFLSLTLSSYAQTEDGGDPEVDGVDSIFLIGDPNIIKKTPPPPKGHSTGPEVPMREDCNPLDGNCSFQIEPAQRAANVERYRNHRADPNEAIHSSYNFKYDENGNSIPVYPHSTHGCQKSDDGQTITCEDGVYKKSASVNEDLRIIKQNLHQSNTRSRPRPASAKKQ